MRKIDRENGGREEDNKGCWRVEVNDMENPSGWRTSLSPCLSIRGGEIFRHLEGGGFDGGKGRRRGAGDGKVISQKKAETIGGLNL